MKKIMFCTMTAFLLLLFVPTQLKAAAETGKTSIAATKTVQSTDANAQLARLEEIKAMDLSTLNRSEKRELRKEVSSIKSAQDEHSRRYHDGRGGRDYDGRHHGGVMYFSIGGGLLLILLIILLL